MRYLGCKTILLDWIEALVKDLGIRGGVFADLFAGTTAVAQHFKALGFQLITSDIMSFSYAFQQAYIATNELPRFERLRASSELGKEWFAPREEMGGLMTGQGMRQGVLPLAEVQPYTALAGVIAFLNHLEPEKGFLYTHYTLEGTAAANMQYRRQYFSAANAGKLDAIRSRIESWRTRGLLTESEYYLLVTAVIEAASSVSNTAGTYGAFLKDWDQRALKSLVLVPPQVVPSTFKHRVFLRDANELVREITCDVLYLDPPYNQRQYAAYYHLLDTIARWDQPRIYGKTGRRPYLHQLSRYCTPEAATALAELVRDARCEHLLMSYNDEGLLSRQEILDILATRGQPQFYEYDYRRYSSHAASRDAACPRPLAIDTLIIEAQGTETQNKKASRAVKEWMFYVHVER